MKRKKKYNILLLTNRDSDNVGDQVIEACDLALIQTVMKNLNITETEYQIDSQAASIVSKKYLQTRDKKLLKTADKRIKVSDMVIFGGAPLFNYQYQMFYERTSVTLELAQKYHIPVIFSAIGIEQYDEKNEKCQRLKKTLNFDCVKQITTRDGIEELKKYRVNEQVIIDRVSDPAVFAAETFRNYVKPAVKSIKKRVGIFVFRANGFKDNKIDFSREDAVNLWKGIIQELEDKGYDYRLLTSGHFGDEAFLDYLIKKHGIEESKCIFNMNTPEKLLEEIASFDAVISCRLHPSIISYSLNIPSVGIVWNPKVKYFYECIGYPDRYMVVCDINAREVVARLEEAMERKIEKDGDYLMSVYRYLYNGIRKALNLTGDEQELYDYETFTENIPAFAGTPEEEQYKKLERKFRRIYETLNTRAELNVNLKKELQELKEVTEAFEMSYRTSSKGENAVYIDNWMAVIDGKMNRTSSNAYECRLQRKVKNDGSEIFSENIYQHKSKEFCGWHLRFRSGNVWFWYLEDGTFCQKDRYDKNVNKGIKVFLPGEKVPYIPLPGVNSVVADAKWMDNRN